ncbi:hypothetical protein [Amycolatopsis rubida]|uniref:Secreted protein n=1 Tax=Amycolatopsis rubida TaxID=112413 RepID=A0A1I5TX39_9PSEU|nr:hypothetical protein [Amycolatopsis rubida]SFP87650.1 hypothetical protein SAMN05421854_107284 [Amycolatopsis rubida]
MKKLRIAAAAALTAGLTVLAPAVADATPMPLTFGVYPGGYAGGGSTTGKPDNPAEVRKALAQLQSGHRPFLLRDYLGCGSAFPDDEMRYLAPGRRLDVVLSYSGESMPEWQSCVEKTVHRYGPIADTISVTLEQNVVPRPNGDTALVQGVVTGRKAADRDGFGRLRIGFDEVARTRPFTQF